MRASDYADPRIVAEVTLSDDYEIASEAPDCACCGGRLNWETWDPAGYRGVQFHFTEVTLKSWDAECLDEEPEVETFRAHDECATDFQDAVRLAQSSVRVATKEAA